MEEISSIVSWAQAPASREALVSLYEQTTLAYKGKIILARTTQLVKAIFYSGK